MDRESLFTARWNITQALEGKDVNAHITEAQKQLQKALLSRQEPEPDRPSVSAPAAKFLNYPFANQKYKMPTKGNYPNNYPKGVVVHFTAGRCDSEADCVGSINWGKGENYAFWAIGPTGVVYQTHTLDRWGSHAGTSSYRDLGSGLSNQLLGIEVACAGRTDANGKSWFGVTYAKDRLRSGPAKDNCAPGSYVMFTPAQEEALTKLILWLKSNNPEHFSLDFVLGHDSIAPGRKNDPGWSLSMTIPEYQDKLKKLYDQQSIGG